MPASIRYGVQPSGGAEPEPKPRGWDFSLRAVLPPCRLKPELHACFGGTDRHATVGAALCGRSSLPRRGAPTDLATARGAGIFIVQPSRNQKNLTAETRRTRRFRPWERTLPACPECLTPSTQDACAPRVTQRKTGREKPFQPGKKFKLHSIGDTEIEDGKTCFAI